MIFSADTDLLPALETVCAPATGYASRISIPQRRIWCHYLDGRDFAAVADTMDYA